MSQRSQAKGELDRLMVDPPSWAQCFMAMAGVVLLIGPTLVVLWPH